METLVGMVASGSNAGGRTGRIFSYVRFLVIAVTVMSFFKKMLFTHDPDELKLMPDEELVKKPTTFSGKISHRIMKTQFKSKGLALKDYGKSLERREYEKMLDLIPKSTSKERFLIHEEPEEEYQNITSWIYEPDKKEKVASYQEPVPTLEFVKYMNSFDDPQIVIPAWEENDLVDFSYYISAYPFISQQSLISGDIAHELVQGINLQETKEVKLNDFQITLPQDSQDLFMHAYMRRSGCSVGKFPGDDTCLISSNKTMRLTFTNPNNFSETLYNPNMLITLSYNKGELLLSQVDDYFKPHLIVDDFTGRRDNSSGIAVRYFPYIEYDSFWQRKNELKVVPSKGDTNVDRTINFEIKVETNKFLKLQFRLKIISIFLKKYLEIPLTQFKGMADFDFKFDFIKKAILDYSQNQKTVSGVVLFAQVVFSLLGFSYEAPINAGINATSHLITGGLQLLILINLFMQSNKEGISLMVLSSTFLSIFISFIKANELYAKKLYEKIDIKPKVFKGKQQFSEKTLYFFEKYPKALKKIESDFENYRSNVAPGWLITYALPISILVTGYKGLDLQLSLSSCFSAIMTLLTCLSYTVIILNDFFILYENYTLKQVFPLKKELKIFKAIYCLINLTFVVIAKMPLMHMIYLISPIIIHLTYLYQLRIYKVIEIKYEVREDMLEKNRKEKAEIKKEYQEEMEKKTTESLKEE